MCLSKYNLALRAKFKFETDVFFLILLRKIRKNTSVSKEYSAAAGGKNLRAATYYVDTENNIYPLLSGCSKREVIATVQAKLNIEVFSAFTDL